MAQSNAIDYPRQCIGYKRTKESLDRPVASLLPRRRSGPELQEGVPQPQSRFRVHRTLSLGCRLRESLFKRRTTTLAARRFCTFGSQLVEEPVARRSGCIQHVAWLALNIADWSTSIKQRSAYGRNSER